ncbi:M48 family metalloprotease [Pseudomonadota bacterium]
MKGHSLSMIFVMLVVCSMAPAVLGDIQPKIPPGYVPEDAVTEKGIWMELSEYENAIRRSALLVTDKKLNDYVKSAACRVAGDYCNDLRVYIIRNPNFNASMGANGVMQIWTGLLVRVTSEDELAAVLGHELAHYTQLHTLTQLRKANKNLTAGSIFDLGLVFLTGTSVPVGQMAAIASLMAFSRDQEEEADLLGVKFMREAGYDPNAAARVWEMIVEEETSAAVKRRQAGIFSQTHPSSKDRISTLKRFASNNDGKVTPNETGRINHVNVLNHFYMQLMEDQIDTNRFGRTDAILAKHRKIGVEPSLVDFFYGEMYRQRNGLGDIELAKGAYDRATKGEKPVPEAHLNLGYIYLKDKTLPQARHHFMQYLELRPDADDRAMIEFYLEEMNQ